MDRIAKSADAVGVNFTMAAAALSLSQIYLETGRAADAVKLLEDAKIGPLMLVEAKSPIAAEGTFAVETCKAALRAYVATQQLEKAEKAMNVLESQVAKGDAQSNQTLIAIYRRIGQELENHVASLRKENRTDELQAVSRGFDLFLDRIAGKQEGNNFNSLNWVAETYSRLGTGHEGDDDAISASAQDLLRESRHDGREDSGRDQGQPRIRYARCGLGRGSANGEESAPRRPLQGSDRSAGRRAEKEADAARRAARGGLHLSGLGARESRDVRPGDRRRT